jgi:hypothetical protein
MSKIINTMVVIVILGLAAVSFVILKFDDTTAAIIVLVPLALHFLPRVAGPAVRALARHCRRVLRPYFTTSNKNGASSCRKIVNRPTDRQPRTARASRENLWPRVQHRHPLPIGPGGKVI